MPPMPRARSNGQDGPKAGKKGGGLIGLVKRKPLEALGAAAGVAGVLYLVFRHKSASPAGGGTVARVAPARQAPRGGSRGYGAQIAALQRQIDALDQRRRRHPGPPRKHAPQPPTWKAPGRWGAPGGGGGPAPGRRHR